MLLAADCLCVNLADFSELYRFLTRKERSLTLSVWCPLIGSYEFPGELFELLNTGIGA